MGNKVNGGSQIDKGPGQIQNRTDFSSNPVKTKFEIGCLEAFKSTETRQTVRSFHQFVPNMEPFWQEAGSNDVK